MALYSGLLITLSADQELRDKVLLWLDLDPQFEVGELVGNLLPIAMEARDPFEAEEKVRMLQSVEGIDFVDVVSVEFERQSAEQNEQSSEEYSGTP